MDGRGVWGRMDTAVYLAESLCYSPETITLLISYAFELWCWRRLLRVPRTARRSNQSILKEISPGCWLEGLMLKLKLQYFGHLMWRADSFEKTLILGKIEGRRRRGRQRMRRLDGINDSMDMVLGGLRELWWTGRPGVLWFMGSQRVGHDWATELNWIPQYKIIFLKNEFMFREFPGGLVAKTPSSQCGGSLIQELDPKYCN